ncbi:MAG: DUF1571 domain-containing protein [Planctomycetales bacterium]|nr:DUF1571 domain-containing protein [Planctomycetales bacterium]
MSRSTQFRWLRYSACAVMLVAMGFLIVRTFFPGNESHSSVATEISSAQPVVVDRSKQAEQSPASAGDPTQHPLDAVLSMAHDMLQDMRANLQDYTAILVKRERIRGTLGDETKMLLKVRNPIQTPGNERGLSVYVKFLEPSSTAGREVIWVDGANDGKLISHEAGLKNIARFKLAPDGMLAMFGNKYPITEIGLLRMVEKLIEKGNQDRELGTCLVDKVEGEQIGGRPCQLVQVTHTDKRPEFDFHIAQIFIDSERRIPLRYAAFLWPENPAAPAPLEEEYTYLDLQTNVGLTDKDFDADNPEYGFP